jgi:DNA (cytosine-5)-methyltransferase 1
MATFIELCSGAGGLSAGFIKAGFKPILLNEIDKTCCITLRKHLEREKILPSIISCIDMKKLDLTTCKADLLIGSPPCQSYSLAGKKKGLDDARGNLMLEFARLLYIVNPKVFLIENVKGLVIHNKGQTLLEILKQLNPNDQYNIQYKVLNAWDYNVAQKRERVFIIGVRKDVSKIYKFPAPIKPKLVLKDVLLNCPVSAGYKYPEWKRELMEMIPAGGCWINLPQVLQKEYLGESYNAGGGKRGIARRLSMNEPSLTLTTSPCQKQTERCHPIETRPLTVREYARIQSFPDDYEFDGSIAQQYKQIGNAVPVNLAFHIAKSILNVL